MTNFNDYVSTVEASGCAAARKHLDGQAQLTYQTAVGLYVSSDKGSLGHVIAHVGPAVFDVGGALYVVEWYAEPCDVVSKHLEVVNLPLYVTGPNPNLWFHRTRQDAIDFINFDA